MRNDDHANACAIHYFARAACTCGPDTETPKPVAVSREQALADALAALVDLHHDWTKGSAYLTVRFAEQNDAAIAAAKAALARPID